MTDEIDEIALRAASKLDSEIGLAERTTGFWPIAFAHELLAELSKDAEPVATVESHSITGMAVFSLRLQNWLPHGTKLFTHPAPGIASEQKPVASDVMGRVESAVSEAIGGDAYDCTRVWSAWGYGTMDEGDFVPVIEQGDRVSEIASAAIAACSPPNTVDIERRVAEACAKYCDNLKTYHIETGRPVLASVAEHAAHYLRGGIWRKHR